MLLDYIDVIVHVQHAEERVYYALERLWKDCPTVELPEEVRRGDPRSAPTGARRRPGRRPEHRRRRRLVLLAARPDGVEPRGPLPGAAPTSSWTTTGRGQAERAARLLGRAGAGRDRVLRPAPGRRRPPQVAGRG